MTLYCDIMLIVSLVLMLAYVCMWHKHFDVHITLVFTLVPVVNLGYCLLSRSQSLGEALQANGASVFEKHSIRKTRRRVNPCGGYDVVKTEKWTALYVNGTYVRGAALSNFTS